MYETTNKLRDREDARQNTLRENCVQRERKQFTVPEILERSERLHKEKDSERNSFVIEVTAETSRVGQATILGAVAVGVGTAISKNDVVKGELGVDQVDEVNFLLEIGGYVAKESVNDVATGVNLSDEQSTGVI